VVDAVALPADGTPEAVIDWKSDVAPSADAIEGYLAEVQAYLEALGLNFGLLVFVTTGHVVKGDTRFGGRCPLF